MPTEDNIINILRETAPKYFGLHLNALEFVNSLAISSIPQEQKEKLLDQFMKNNPGLEQYDIPESHKLITICTLSIIGSFFEVVRDMFKQGYRVIIKKETEATIEPELPESVNNRENIIKNINSVYGFFRNILNYILKTHPDSYITPLLSAARDRIIAEMKDLYDVVLADW